MKKFFNLFITAMVMCAAVSMTSCSKDDSEDPIINPGANQNEDVNCFVMELSPAIFDYYDIQLTISNKSKQEVITLKKSDGVKYTDDKDYEMLSIIIDKVDGVAGVKETKATVTPKANIEELLKALDPDQKTIYISYASDIVKKETTGHRIELGSNSHTSRSLYSPTDMMAEKNGSPLYKTLARTLQVVLSSI